MIQLEDLFSIRYRASERTPIQVRIVGNQVSITCRFRYNRRALQPAVTGQPSPADLIEAGIIRSWSGTYDLRQTGLDGLTEPAEVRVRIVRQQGWFNRPRSVPIIVRRLLWMPAHVISPPYRRLWGIIKTGQLESLGTNWSLGQPGRMMLPLGLDPGVLEMIAAHEAGHLFGLGDAYAAIYRFYDAAPGTDHYMMHSNQAVQPAEILMLLRAHQCGRMQYFPRHWQSRRFWRGLKLDARLRIAELRRRNERLRLESRGKQAARRH